MGEAVKKEDDVLAKVIVGMFSFVHGGRGEIRSQEREREKAPFFSWMQKAHAVLYNACIQMQDVTGERLREDACSVSTAKQ